LSRPSGTRNLAELQDRTGNVITPTVAYGNMVVQLYRPDLLDAIILRAKGAS
jgi:hypothetical protein